jgi:hypothetical protein
MHDLHAGDAGHAKIICLTSIFVEIVARRPIQDGVAGRRSKCSSDAPALESCTSWA